METTVNSFEKKREVRERGSGSLYRTTSQKEQEQLLVGGVDFVETIIARIVSEPVHAMSRKFVLIIEKIGRRMGLAS